MGLIRAEAAMVSSASLAGDVYGQFFAGLKRSCRFDIVAAFVACALATPAVAGKADNSVMFATEETLGSADPYFGTSPLSFTVADSIWDTLIFRDPRTGEYKGELATAWHW